MRNFQVGDIVLLADVKTPRGLWPLARILDVKRNKKDGLEASHLRLSPAYWNALLEVAAEVPEEMKGPVKACID